MRTRRPKPARAPRREIAPPPRLDRRTFEAPAPIEILDLVSGPFERHLDAAPRGAHRRR